MKKSSWLIVAVMAIVMCVGNGWAGEKEEAQLTLEKALLQLHSANLQFQIRAADDPGIQAAKQNLNVIVKQITDKGFIIDQNKDGVWVVTQKPPKQEGTPPKTPEK